MVLEWIDRGVTLPFRQVPESQTFQNRPMDQIYSDFISEEIRRMVQCGAVMHTKNKPTICSPIHAVPKKNGKFRLVIDMRYLNSHLIVPKFKMEGLESLAKIIEPDDSMFTTDLADGYYHINMSVETQTYLGFQWKGEYFVFRVLPFGLAISPLVFTKTMRVIISHLRQLGHRILVYLDDFIGLSREKNLLLRKIFLRLLTKLGLQISKEKSSLDLTYEKEFLGLLVSTKGRPMFFVPPKKKSEVTKEITRLLSKAHMPLPARRVARVAGLCISLSRAVGPTRLLMRNLFQDLKTKSSWNGKITLSQDAIQDLIWWKSTMTNWDGKIVVPSKTDLVLFTDASNSGWGGQLEDKSASGFWTPSMLIESINYRELMAVFMSLLSFKAEVRGKAVLVRTDNISAAAYINKMTGSSTNLFNLGRSIQNLTKELEVELMAQYIPGVDNIQADRLSRIVDKNDWMLHPTIFKELEKKWGPHTIDRMATFTNHQVERYNSYRWDPRSEAVNAYAQDWRKENNYVNPPFNQMMRILEKIQEDKATCTVIAPIWKAQMWYHTLLKMSIDYPMVIPNLIDTFLPGTTGNVEPMGNPRWAVAAWRISGANIPKIGIKNLESLLQNDCTGGVHRNV